MLIENIDGLTNKDFWKSDKIEVFPSSNATDAGKITSEENLFNIVRRITSKNYCLRASLHPSYGKQYITDSDLEFTPKIVNNKIVISRGRANIYGHDVTTDSELTIEATPTSTGTLYILVRLFDDGHQHVGGDEQDNITKDYFCSGIYADLGEPSTVNEYSLVLGTVEYDGTNFSNLIENPHRFTIIDSSDVDINNNEFNSTNLSDLINELLDTFIMREGENRLNGHGGDFYASLYGRTNKSSEDYRIKLNLSQENDEQYIEVKPLTDNEDYIARIGSDLSNGPYLGLGDSKLYAKNGDLYLSGKYPFIVEPESHFMNDFYIDNTKGAHLSTVESKFIFGSSNYTNNPSSGSGVYIDTGVTEGDNYSELSMFSGNASIRAIFNGTELGVFPSNESQYINFRTKVTSNEFYVKNTDGWTRIYKDYISYTNSSVNFTVDNTNGISMISDDKRYIRAVSEDRLSYAHLCNKGYLSVCGKTNSSDNVDKAHIYFQNISSAGADPDSKANITLIENNTLYTDASLFRVAGDVRANRVFNAVYNDVAEFMEKDENETIEPGDLVCVRDDEKYHKVSCREDIGRIVGVCSSEETYGYVLGGDGLNNNQKVAVGLAGRVYVKVNKESEDKNSIRFINPGDNLTVDINTGLAVKSYKANDIIIGKAVRYAKNNKVYMLIK